MTRQNIHRTLNGLLVGLLICSQNVGCSATPRAEIKPAKSGVTTDRQATPPQSIRKSRTVLRINVPPAPPVKGK